MTIPCKGRDNAKTPSHFRSQCEIIFSTFPGLSWGTVRSSREHLKLLPRPAGFPAVVRRTVGWRSFRKRFLMNRKSSLYPGVDGTGVEGRGVSEPLAAGTPRSVPLRGGVCRTLAAGTARSVLVRGGVCGTLAAGTARLVPVRGVHQLRSRLPRGTANSCGSLKIAPARSAAPPFDAPPEFIIGLLMVFVAAAPSLEYWGTPIISTNMIKTEVW